jgi:S-adenosylmethionine hydrolase
VHVDRFGNLVTNIDRRAFEAFAGTRPVTLTVGGHAVAGVVATYADIRAEEICGLFGSTDHLESAANGGSAATAMAVTRGAVVEVTRSAP